MTDEIEKLAMNLARKHAEKENKEFMDSMNKLGITILTNEQYKKQLQQAEQRGEEKGYQNGINDGKVDGLKLASEYTQTETVTKAYTSILEMLRKAYIFWFGKEDAQKIEEFYQNLKSDMRLESNLKPSEQK